MTRGAVCRPTRDIKFRIAVAKAAFSNKKILVTSIGFKFKEGTSEILHLERSFAWC
jgi:hypothetical protein